jgi:Fibronectin type III domain.
MKKKILATLLCVCIVLMLLPMMSIPAFAAPVTEDYVAYLYTDGKFYTNDSGGTDITTAMASAGAVVSGTAGNRILTLTNFNFETTAYYGLQLTEDTTIILSGDNTIKSTYSGGGLPSIGIYAPNYDLTIIGDGSLTAAASGDSTNSNYGIYTGISGSLTINGGTVTAIGNGGSWSGAFYPNYTVPNGYKYYVNTTTDPSTTELTGNGTTTKVLDMTHKYAKIVVPVNYVAYLNTDGKFYTNNSVGTDITAEMEAAGAVVGGSPGNRILTLTNFNFETIAGSVLELTEDTTIILSGDNTLKSLYSGSSPSGAIYAAGYAITIMGDGSLTAIASGGSTNSNYGIYIGGSGSLTINSGTVTAIGNGGSWSGAFDADYTVPNGYKYYVNTTTDPSADELTGDGTTTKVLSLTHKYAKIVYALPSSEKDITAFTITGQSGSSTISGTIAVTMPFGTDVTALTPSITVSPSATVSPTSDTAQDFTSPVTYTVTAADTSTETYTVTVTVAPATAPDTPQSFTATPGNGQVALSWTTPADDGGSAITKYEVSSDNGGTWTDASTSTAHTFTGLTSGTAYTFKVRAVNAIGNGAEATATATPTSGSSSGSSSGGGSGSAKITGGTTTTDATPPTPVEQPQNTNQNNNQTDNQNAPQPIDQQMDSDESESKLTGTIAIVGLIVLVVLVIGGVLISGVGRKK